MGPGTSNRRGVSLSKPRFLSSRWGPPHSSVVVDEPVARKKGVAPILGRNEHVPSIYILQPTFEQIVVQWIIPNHRDASVWYLFKKPEDPLDGRSLRSLVPLDFLERHHGRDQIDLSVTVSCKKPIEGRGLRGIVILYDRADDVIF